MTDIDMSGFQMNAFGQDISSGSDFWDYSLPDNIIGDSVGSIFSDTGNIPDASSTTVGMLSNVGSFPGTLSGAADTLLGGAKSVIDYGLGVGTTALNAYGKIQALDTQKYISQSQIDIAKQNANTAAKTNAQLGEAKVQMATAAANASRSTAGLASLGQNSSSMMLYLTILGVAFAGIQLLRSAK